MSVSLLRVVVSLALVAVPASAIVIPSAGFGQDSNPADYLAPYGTVAGGVNLNGVVQVNFVSRGCTGALISSTQVLTAGHCINGSGSVVFVDGINGIADNVTSVAIYPGYVPGQEIMGGDLAILNLADPAPAFATVYSIFNGSYTFGSPITVVGFGYTGSGTTGMTTDDGQRRVGQNEYNITGNQDNLGWSANMLVASFAGTTGAQTYDYFANTPYAGGNDALANEVDLGFGDSGGPSFYNGQIIGVHDVLDCAGTTSCTSPPSYGGGASPDSYYGEIFGDTSAEAYAGWINSQLTPEPGTWMLCALAIPILLRLKRR